VFIQLARSNCCVFMASWLAREKRVPGVVLELLEKAMQRLQTAGWRPPLLGVPQAQRTPRPAPLARRE
jgi:hypothetical protein